MHRVTVLGAGKIGSAIAKLLHRSGDYAVRVGDTNSQALERLVESVPVETLQLDVTDAAAVAGQLRDAESVVSACPFSASPSIASAALRVGASYFDMTEDVATTRTVRAIASQAREGQVFVPQCGLAPGFISILAAHLCRDFQQLEEVKMRVGALPRYPSNLLKYNLTWSTEGLINEYCNPCEAICNGQKVEVMPLEGLEHFSIEGVEYEAFNTSGGLGTLWQTLEGRVRTLNYKTLRYKGHCYLMRFLLEDLGLSERRSLLKEILEKAVPTTTQDVALIFCSASGWKDGQFVQLSDVRKIYHTQLDGEHWSSIQLSTASSLCAVLDLHVAGLLPRRGSVEQERVSLEAFLANRFGRVFSAC